MLCHIQDYGKYAEITGFCNVSFERAETFLKTNRQKFRQVDIQFFDADLVATREHLYFAALNALQAFLCKTNISKTVAMETMLYASSVRQIQKAINCLGIKPQTKNMAVIILGNNPELVDSTLKVLSSSIGVRADDSVLGLTEEKLQRIRHVFAISSEELETQADVDSGKAFVDLIVEHMALLATET